MARRGFTPQQRLSIWSHYSGAFHTTQCPMCQTDMNVLSYDISHIKSLKNGGDEKIENLMPLCASCNRSIGEVDVNIEKLHPKSFLLFSDPIRKLYVAQTSFFNNKNVQRAPFNRPPDEERIQAIQSYLVTSSEKIIPGIIYFYISENTYWIYDGVHRFKATSGMDYTMIYSVLNSPNGAEHDFITLNSSHPVSELYKDSNASDKKKFSEDIISFFRRDFYEQFSHQNSANRPFFNQKKIEDIIHGITGIRDIEEFINAVKTLNSVVKNEVEKGKNLFGLKRTTVEKLNKFSNPCFIFILPLEEIIRRLDSIMWTPVESNV